MGRRWSRSSRRTATTRGWGPPFLGDTAWYFMGVNRNKEAALDLSRDEGRAILWRLLEEADVLVENFKPGTLARWGWTTRATCSRASRA